LSQNPKTVSPIVVAFRLFAWGTLTTLATFLINNYLNFWREWPGATSALDGGGDGRAWVQVAIYGAGIAAAAAIVRRRRQFSLRQDHELMTAMSAYVVRAAFFAVVLVGLADTVLSFLRVEGLLEGIFGRQMANEIGINRFRAPWVHLPLIVVSLAIAALVRRTLGFTWLALLVVVAEMLIVISRFIFSYEQAFMGDLVRFWYAALFLFASAYTLHEEGHVRVDVLYTNFSERTKGISNAVGTLLLGISLCWVVLYFGMATKSSVINGPVISLEVTQQGFGMYVKYLMAGFLAVYAVSMMIQFCGYLLESVADARGEPGKRVMASAGAH